ncbi:hypothetical protein DQ04_01371060 [Trypanosoma grayi]|uniref:hypothetical protein n=1 Tax=Trypanosoma grayi TaxID=71804 RepID=UPI0004F46E6D|nr:hypothetical protein DQ04_01371060 [Trypanosoma grayi]KEG12859.1 hypothetical protein DQ04_01371060 [Trypanosoma grayi]
MPTFESFCAEESLRQRREGFKVPTTAESSAYLQWQREARRRWEATNGKDEQSLITKEVERGAASVIAAVENEAHCKTFALLPSFLPPQKEQREMVSFLELLLRLSMLDRDNAGLLAAIGGFRSYVTELQKKGVLACSRGKYPEVYILYELFSLRKILLNWGKFKPEHQKAAADTALALVDHAKSPKYTKLGIQLREAKENSQPVGGAITDIVISLEQACGDTPYAFPSLCRKVMAVVHPHYTGPSGTLVSDIAPENAVISGDNITSSDDECVGSIIKVNRLAVKRPRLEYTRSLPNAVGSTDHATKAAVVSGHDACCSKFHALYSKPEKHASKGCQFCVVCHMMEKLFNGYANDCYWNHRPTERRIMFHLRRFPDVCATALQRLSNLEQGVVLPPFHGIPLG